MNKLLTNESITTSWSFCTTNEHGWETMLTACESAKISIDLEQYIFVTDDIGKRFIDVCTRKASEGVKVRFLWDAAGSFSFFGSSIVEELKQKNIELVFFKTLFPNFLTFHNYKSWYFRNHKRTLVIDNKIGFTGSICFSLKMKNWRDTIVRLQGPVVQDMSLEFQRTWSLALGKENIFHKKSKSVIDKKEFEYVTNYPFPRKHQLSKEIIQKLKSAKSEVFITTPYFIPTRHLSRVLRATAKRGVRVEIIVPEWSDYPVVDLCSRSFFTKMLRSGIKTYLYQGKMMHTKTMIIDKDWSTIGTLNLDSVSLLYNFEANIISTNTDFREELKKQFDNDLIYTKEVTLKEWEDRYWLEKFSSLFLRFLRDFL